MVSLIYSVRGKLIHADPTVAVVECGGVGLRCRISMTTARRLPALGGEVSLFTILNVREDAMELYGFAEQAELQCFKQLTAVSGVGPKAAGAILSALSPERVALAVAAGDFKTITQAQGVGPKLAQRIVLELKDKVAALQSSAILDMPGDLPAEAGGLSAARNASEAVSALTVLGFTPGEASAAVGKLDSDLPVEQLIKQALKSLAKQ